MRVGRKAWKALLAAVLTMLGLETALRLHYRERGWPSIYRPDPELGWVLRPGWRGRYLHQPTEINELGLRDRRNRAAWLAAPRRLLVLGDSVGFGYGVSEGEHLAPRLDELLGGRGWAVATAAVPGYDTELEVRWLERHGADLAPDAMLLAYCLNDDHRAAADHLGQSVDLSVLLNRPRLIALTERSALAYKLLKETQRWRRRHGPAAPAGTAPPMHTVDVPAALVRLHAWCATRAIPLEVVVFPLATDLDPAAGDAPAHRQILERCTGLSIPAFDLTGPLRALGHGPALFLSADVCHLSPAGHLAAARVLAPRVVALEALAAAQPRQRFDK